MYFNGHIEKARERKIRGKMHIIRSQVQITFQNGPKSSEVSKWLLECNRNINGKKKILWEMCLQSEKRNKKFHHRYNSQNTLNKCNGSQ